MKGKQKLTNLSGDAIRVISHLQTGKKKARSRAFLMRKTDLSDRRVRRAVAELRAQGYPVCSITAKPGGYWLSNEASELREFIAQLELQRDFFGKAIRRLRERLGEIESGKVRV